MESKKRHIRYKPAVIKHIKIEEIPVIKLSDKYQIRKMIKSGAQGRVFQALRLADKASIAAKCIYVPDLQTSDKYS